jgi:hypothetical protein
LDLPVIRRKVGLHSLQISFWDFTALAKNHRQFPLHHLHINPNTLTSAPLISPNGCCPNENISHNVTPKLHTSLA